MTMLRIALLILATLAAGFAAAQTDEGGHAHEEHGDLADLSLNDGEKWESDQPLREGMSSIHEALAGVLDEAHADELDREGYQELAGAIDGQVEFMFANCDLDPEPDAQLHVILASLMKASRHMKESDQPRQAIPVVLESLKAYGNTFEHPDWNTPSPD